MHRTTISHALHKLGLYGRVARREPLMKQSHVGGTANMWRKVLWSDETKIDTKCKMAENYHPENSGRKLSPWTHHPHCETWWWQHHAMGTLFFSRDREAGLSWWEDGWSQIQDNLGRKPVRVCKRLETGAEVQLPISNYFILHKWLISAAFTYLLIVVIYDFFSFFHFTISE